MQQVTFWRITTEIDGLQNPTACKGRPLLVLNLVQWFHPEEGLGFRIAIVAAALAEGYYKKRTVVFGNATHEAWWEQFFKPLSACRLEGSRRSEGDRSFGDKGLALFVLPKKYRKTSGQLQGKLFGAAVISYALRLQPWLQALVDADASCYGVRAPGAVTMHVRRGDNTNFADKVTAQLPSFLKVIEDVAPEEGRRIYICSDSAINATAELDAAQLARWPSITLVGKEGNCSRHEFANAALGERVHSDLGADQVVVEAIRDIYLLAAGGIFVGMGSSHFSTTTSLLRFALSPKSDIVRERFVDAKELAAGLSPLGLLPISNWPDGPHETGPAGPHRFREIGVRYSWVSDCEEGYLKLKRKGAPVVNFDKKLHTTVMNYKVFDRSLKCRAWQ